MAKQALTSKQEKFCQLVAAGAGLSEAYREAYDASRMKKATVNRKATELNDNGKVAARIETLQAKHAKRHEITVDDLVGELEEARKLSHQVEQPASAVSATMGKGKLLGLIVDKSDNKHSINFSNMSDDELKAIIAKVGG